MLVVLVAGVVSLAIQVIVEFKRLLVIGECRGVVSQSGIWQVTDHTQTRGDRVRGAGAAGADASLAPNTRSDSKIRSGNSRTLLAASLSCSVEKQSQKTIEKKE